MMLSLSLPLAAHTARSRRPCIQTIMAWIRKRGGFNVRPLAVPLLILCWFRGLLLVLLLIPPLAASISKSGSPDRSKFPNRPLFYAFSSKLFSYWWLFQSPVFE